MSGQPVNIDSLARAVNELQRQLSEAHTQITNQRNELNVAAQKVGSLEQQLVATGSHNEGKGPNAPKKNKPSSFNGKGSVSSWCVQMSNYLGDRDGLDSMNCIKLFDW